MKTFLRECRWSIVLKLLYLLIKSTPMDSDEGLKLHRMIGDFLDFLSNGDWHGRTEPYI